MVSKSTDEHRRAAREQLGFAVITVSDSRTIETDKSGQLLIEAMVEASHQLLERRIVPDEPPQIATAVQQICQHPSIDVILVTGGTGIAPRDCTPEAIVPLFDLVIPGFGELFRMLSYEEIGAAAMLSRAIAGKIGDTLVLCLPGSTAAVRLAVEKLLIPELPHLVHHSRG